MTPADSVLTSAVSRHRSLWLDVWRQFRSHTGAVVGVGVFVFIVLGIACIEVSRHLPIPGLVPEPMEKD